MTQESPEGRPRSSSGRPARRVRKVPITSGDVDQNALRVLSRLHRNGYEAYLVGGCVRDLLLGRNPKDFDIATEAHPRQIKRLFKNGRIIGRRFRLVHVVYGQQFVETATFRREPEEKSGGDDGDLLITEDNEFGTAEEDARRRDFTVNGLFLEPASGSWRVHDYVGGLEDLEDGLLRTIGVPRVRFAEDPVRILRAIKFATRLGFRIEDETWDAMCEQAGELVRSAAPRVFEELLRLLRSGTALGAFRMMRACGALRVLLPGIDDYLGTRNDPDPKAHDRADQYWRLLEALDADVHVGHEPPPHLCLAVLFLRIIEDAAERRFGKKDPEPRQLAAVAAGVLDDVTGPARVSRRIVEKTKRIVVDQRRFTQPSSKSSSRVRFMMSEDFEDSLDLLKLRLSAWGQGWDVYEGWRERYLRFCETPDEDLEELRSKSRRRRPRRRPRGGRASGG